MFDRIIYHRLNIIFISIKLFIIFSIINIIKYIQFHIYNINQIYSSSSDKLIYIKNDLYVYNFSILSINNNYSRIYFFIESSSNHDYKRNIIRKTWAKLCQKISCNYNFVIATKGITEKIIEENKNDMIGVDICDSYYNLTIMTHSIYRYYCIHNINSDYVIKNDDDIYPNIPLITLYINIYFNKSMISGFYYPKMKVSRDRNSSVYLPKSTYPYNYFPNFVAGGFVITPSNLILRIYKELLNMKIIIYREDMHMAVIYDKLKIQFQKLNKYYHRKEKFITLQNKLCDICYHGF